MDGEQFDIESNAASSFLKNDSVQSFQWTNLTVTVKDRKSKRPLSLISDVNGYVQQGMTEQWDVIENISRKKEEEKKKEKRKKKPPYWPHLGELLALMGPSGCGKTTLLNVLARREASSGAKVQGKMFVNGGKVDKQQFQRMSSYVEQEDALIGSLTVKETMKFAADLSLPGFVSPTVSIPSLHLDWRVDMFFFSKALSRKLNGRTVLRDCCMPLESKGRLIRWLELLSVKASVAVKKEGLESLASSSHPLRFYSWMSRLVVWTRLQALRLFLLQNALRGLIT